MRVQRQRHRRSREFCLQTIKDIVYSDMNLRIGSNIRELAVIHPAYGCILHVSQGQPDERNKDLKRGEEGFSESLPKIVLACAHAHSFGRCVGLVREDLLRKFSGWLVLRAFGDSPQQDPPQSFQIVLKVVLDWLVGCGLGDDFRHNSTRTNLRQSRLSLGEVLLPLYFERH